MGTVIRRWTEHLMVESTEVQGPLTDEIEMLILVRVIARASPISRQNVKF